MPKVSAEKIASMSAVKCAMLGIIGMVGLLISAVGPFKVPFAETLAKTYYRQAVLGLLLVAVATAALVTAVVKLFDPNQFKGQMVRWVHERTQRDLVLDGELTMRYFPKLGIESGKVSLSQRRSAREFASLDSARVTIAWLPLLRGHMQIDTVELDGLRAQLVRFKDGSTNVDDLARDLTAIAPATVDLDSLRIERAALQWHDELLWQRGSLHDVQIEVGRIADGVPGPLTASARMDAAVAAVDARLQLKGRLLFDSAASRIELARIEGKLEGKALGIDNLTLQLKGDVSALPRERALNADNLVLSAMHKSGLSMVTTVISAPDVKLGEYRWSGTSLRADVSVAHPDRTSTWAITVPRFEWAERALRDTAVNAVWTVKRADSRLHATLNSPLTLVLDGGPRLELSAIDMVARASHPALAADLTAQLKGKFEVDGPQHTAHAALGGQLAGSDFKADVALADWHTRARWTIDADLAHIDADALLSGAWLARWHDDATPFDVAALRDTHLQGHVRVGRAQLGGLKLGALSARVALDQSVLAIAPIAAQAYGTLLDATVRVDAGGASPRVAVTGSAHDIDLRGLMADLTRTPWLGGRGSLTWDLQADGATAGSLRGALRGELQMAAKAGAVGGVDLRAALLDGRADLAKRDAAARARAFDATASTPFNDLKLRLELREGRAWGHTLELSAAALRAVGEGECRFDSGALDVRLQASVGKGVPELAPLAGVTVPVHVSGPWRQPSFAFDFAAATGEKLPRAPEGTVHAPLAMADRLSGPDAPGIGVKPAP